MTIAVFHNTDDVAVIDSTWCDKLKNYAFRAKMKRARLCLHHSDGASLHEMLIVFHRDAIIRPHRHTSKTESYHMIFGELDIVLFDDNGMANSLISMGSFTSGKPYVYRINTPVWHSVIIRSEYAGIHEVTNGPFRIEESEFAPWAPEQLEENRGFLNDSVQHLLKHGTP